MEKCISFQDFKGKLVILLAKLCRTPNCLLLKHLKMNPEMSDSIFSHYLFTQNSTPFCMRDISTKAVLHTEAEQRLWGR